MSRDSCLRRGRCRRSAADAESPARDESGRVRRLQSPDVTAAFAAGRRVLPRGYADFARQLAIWFGFLFAYQVARGLADRDPSRAFSKGWRVLDLDQLTSDLILH